MSTAVDRIRAAYAAERSAPARARTFSVARVGPSKTFTEPPFWSLDSMRLPLMASTTPGREKIENNFEGYVQSAFKSDGIVFACIIARLRVFAQAKFAWCVDDEYGAPGELFTDGETAFLNRRPGPNLSLTELLGQMEIDCSLAGNFFATTVDDAGNMGNAARAGVGRRIKRMRPDWVWIVVSSPSKDPLDLRAKVVAFIYDPPANTGGNTLGPVVLTPDEVCHYAPIPDPLAQHRGMSWLTPILREISADKAATAHKLAFFARGATLSTMVRMDKDISVDAFDAFVERFRAQHEGVDNAYGTLFVGGGADATVLTSNLRDLDYSNVTGAGETRIAAAAGVSPVLVGLSEGLKGSSLNQGNFSAARRLFVDGTMRWLWPEAGDALSTLMTVPKKDAYLHIIDRSIPFLLEDAKDRADIEAVEAQIMQGLIAVTGFTPESVVSALVSHDWRKLKHGGTVSVQQQQVVPGQRPANAPAQALAPNGNGSPAGGKAVSQEAVRMILEAAVGAR